jgi:hypothetical protein
VKGWVLLHAAALVFATGCGTNGSVTPAAPEPLPAPTPAPSPPLASFHVTGIVIDDDSRSVSGASVTVHPDGGNLVSTTTDITGAYTLDFDGRGNPVFSPGYVVVSHPGHEQSYRYLNLALSGQIVQNVRLHRVTRVEAGTMTSIVVGPADSSCGLADEWVCRTIRVTTTFPGTLTLALVGERPASQIGLCAFETSVVPYQCHPSSLTFRVPAGAEVIVELNLEWTAKQEQTLTLGTSLDVQ